MFIEVIFSNDTSKINKIIIKQKKHLKELRKENKLLKQLCYFDKEIQSKAKLELVSNSKLINNIFNSINKNKILFTKFHEIDYQAACSIANGNQKKKPLLIDKLFNEMQSSTKVTDAALLLIKKTEEVTNLYDILNEAVDGNIILSSDLLRLVKKRIEKLTN